jgi:hypothetical protein
MRPSARHPALTNRILIGVDLAGDKQGHQVADIERQHQSQERLLAAVQGLPVALAHAQLRVRGGAHLGLQGAGPSGGVGAPRRRGRGEVSLKVLGLGAGAHNDLAARVAHQN